MLTKAGRPVGKSRPKVLTKAEKELVERMTGQYRKAWHALLLLNKWKPSK